MTSTSAQSSSIKNEMKALVWLMCIPVLRPRFQRPPFGFEAEDGQSDILTLSIWRVFLWGWQSALLSTYVRSLAFTLVRVAFLLSAQLSWLYLCSKNWNAVSQQSLDEALLRDMAGTVLLKSRHITTSHHSLHLHLAHTTQSLGEYFNSKGYLQFLETFPRRGCFPVVACKREYSHSGDCRRMKCRCQVWWRSTLLWPTGRGQEVCSGCSYMLCLPIFSLLSLFVSPLVGGWLWRLSCPFNDPGDGQYPMVIFFVHRLSHSPISANRVARGDQNRAGFTPVLPVGGTARKNMDACAYSLF